MKLVFQNMRTLIPSHNPAGLNKQKISKIRHNIQRLIRSKPIEFASEMPELQILFNSDHSIAFKLLWLSVVLSCTIIFSYQIYDRIHYYLSHPISVDVTIEDIDEFIFPTIKIFAPNNEDTAIYWDYFIDDSQFNRFKKCINPTQAFLGIEGINITEMWIKMNTTKSVDSVRVTFQDKKLDVNYTYEEEKGVWGRGGIIKLETLPRQHVTSKVHIHINRRGIGCKIDYNEVLIVYGLVEFNFALITKSSYNRHVQLYLKEYNYQNSSTRPCSTHKEVKQCYENCLTLKFKQELNCSLPFHPPTLDLPKCVQKPDSMNCYKKSLAILRETQPDSTCRCHRLCQTVKFLTWVYVDQAEDDDTYGTFTLQDSHKTVIIEFSSYRLVNLFVDFGGNLGLFWGLSIAAIIHLFQIGFFSILKLTKKHDYFEKDLARNLNRVTKKRKLSSQKRSNLSFWLHAFVRPNLTNISKTSTLIVCFLCTIYVIYNRISLFLNSPTKFIVEVEELTELLFPNMISCGETEKLISKKQRLRRLQKDPSASCETVHFLDLLDLPEIKNKNDPLMTLWNMSVVGDYDEIARPVFDNVGMGLHSQVIKTKTNMFSGKCSNYTIAPTKFAGLTSAFILTPTVSGKECVTEWQLYFQFSDEEIHTVLDTRIPLPSTIGSSVIINRRKISRINSNRFKCGSRKDYVDCKRNCFMKMFSQRIKCSLPYMPRNDQPSCKTVSEAKMAEDIYLRTSRQTSSHYCNCVPECNNHLFTYNAYSLEKKDFLLTCFIISTSEIAENIVEKFTYSIVSMLCDIGNSIGLFLGTSLLTMFYKFQNFVTSLQITRTKKNMNQRGM